MGYKGDMNTETTMTKSQRMLLKWVKGSFKAYADAEWEIKPKQKKCKSKKGKK